MKPFRVIVGEYDKLMSELDAMTEHDAVLRKRIKETARRQLDELMASMPYTIDHARSARMMEAFTKEATAIVEQREREVLYAERYNDSTRKTHQRIHQDRAHALRRGR